MLDPTEFELTLNGDVVLDDGSVLTNAWIGVTSGTIQAISQVPLIGHEHCDARNKYIFPGFVDVHVHARSSVTEGITATTFAAAAGGTTTIVDMPFDRPARPVNTAEALNAKIADVNNEAIVDVGLYATFPPSGPLDIIKEMADAGAVGFKVSTIEVDPIRFPRIPDGRLMEAFQEIAQTSLLVAAHQENQDIADVYARKHRIGETPDPIAHARSRPPVAEAEAAGRLLELAYWTGAHLHMVHGTIPRTFDLINWNRDNGVIATGETCVHYLILDEHALTRLGGRAKCNPPLRTREDIDQLWLQLENREIDIVTSDHSPYALDKKDTQNIFDAWAGLPGAETLGVLLYSEGVTKGRISLSTFVESLCSGPADIFGFSQKGRIRVGHDADFVIFDRESQWTMDQAKMHYAVGWTTFHGHQVQGRVDATYVRGRCVYRDGNVLGQPGSGHFVSPG